MTFAITIPVWLMWLIGIPLAFMALLLMISGILLILMFWDFHL